MPRLAATVMLVRQGAGRIEVLMLRRSERSHFVPDAYVFPGGTVDASDWAPDTLSRTEGVAQGAAQFRAVTSPSLPVEASELDQNEKRGLLVAAVRELFEEAGVLFSSRPVDAQRLSSLRVQLCEGRVTFSETLRELETKADVSGLTFFSQWITPAVLPRRYNAFFFVARASENDSAIADAVETLDEVWISPRTALERFESGDFNLVYATRKHLERLAEFDDVARLIEFAKNKPIVRVMPYPTADYFAIPPELEFAW